VFSDVSAERYAAEQHNVWHEEHLSEATTAFYGTARALAHGRFLSRFPPFGARRMLDVGCGLGYFVRRALDAGWDAYGCDTSETWTRIAREQVGADRIACGPAHEGPLANARYELVTAWDVLEHVHDPIPFLRSLRTLIAPGGRLFIRTPNLSWIYPTYMARRHLLREEIELGPLNHVVYYTASSLRVALGRAGLEPVDWPVLPPPQVGIANRDPAAAGKSSAVTLLKNTHARIADAAARFSRGRIVVGADLDVLAASLP
jgi:SAM-dependent methyltransferase